MRNGSVSSTNTLLIWSRKCAEELWCQITYRQSTTRWSIEQTLWLRKPIPIWNRPLSITAFHRVIKYNQSQKFQRDRQIKSYSMGGTILLETGADDIIQLVSADIHKIALYVQFQHITFFSIVIWARTYMVFKPPDTEEGTFIYTAGIAVINDAKVLTDISFRSFRTCKMNLISEQWFNDESIWLWRSDISYRIRTE